MIDRQRNSFTGGLNTDIDDTAVKPNEYRFSLNNRIYSIDGDISALRNIEGTEYRVSIPAGYYVIGTFTIDKIVFIFSVDIDGNSEIGCYFIESLRGRKIVKRITTTPPNPNTCSCSGTNSYFYLPFAELKNITNPFYILLNERGLIDDVDKEKYITLFNDTCNSEKLSFDLNHKLDIRVEINFDDSYNLYWTDNLNKPKKFNTITNYQIPIADSNSILTILPINIPTYIPCVNIPCEDIDYCDPGDIPDCMSICLNFSVSLMDLILPLKFPEIDAVIDELVLSGGELKTGSYRACIRYVDNIGNTTHWSYLSGLIEIVEVTSNVPQNIYQGSISDKITGKKFRLKITNLDNRYKYIQMGVVHYTSDVATAGFLVQKQLMTLADINTNSGLGEKFMECDGRFVGTFDVNDLRIESIYIDKSKTIEIVDNILFQANITEENDHNPCFIEIAKNIIVTYEINDPLYKNEPLNLPVGQSVPGFGGGGYKNPYNVFKKTGYWRKQKYGFYIQFVLNNGKKSLLYPIGDNCTNTDLLFESGGDNPSETKSIIDRAISGPVNDIIINYTNVKLSNIDLTSVQSKIQGYAIFRSDRQEFKAIAEGLVTHTPSWNSYEMNDADGDTRYAPIKDDPGWRILNMPHCDPPTTATDKQYLFVDIVLKPNTNTVTDICDWDINPSTNFELSCNEHDKSLSLFVPEPHINTKSLFIKEGARLEFRYDTDKSAFQPGGLTFDLSDICTNTNSDCLAGQVCAPVPDIFASSAIRRYYHRKNDWQTPAPNPIDMEMAVNQSVYIDYDDFKKYIIDGVEYMNIFPAAWGSSVHPFLLTKETNGCTSFRKTWQCRTGSNIVINPKWSDLGGDSLLNPFGTVVCPAVEKNLMDSIAAYLVDIGIVSPELRNVYFTNRYRSIENIANIASDEVKIYGGDCYIVEAFIPIAVQTQSGNRDSDDRNLGLIAGFHIESESNLDLRHKPIDDTVGDNKTFIPYDYFNWKARIGPEREDSREYNKAFSALNNENKGAVFTKDLIDPVNYNLSDNIRRLYSRIIFSTKKILGEKYDTYRDYKASDYKEEQFNYGEINRILNINQNLFVVMDRCLLAEPINTPQMTDTGSGAFQLTSGTLFQQKPLIISLLTGSIHQWSVIKTPIGIYGYDYFNKAIWRYTNKLEIISVNGKVEKLIEDVSNNTTNQETYITEFHNDSTIRQIITNYDAFNKEIYFTFLANEQQSILSQTIVFSEFISKFTGNYFSEKLGFFDGANTIDLNPYYLFSIDDRLFGVNKIASYNIFELNKKGKYGLFFDKQEVPSKIKYVLNKEPSKTKVFDNVIAYFNGYDVGGYSEGMFFDFIRIINEYQDTGLIQLIPTLNCKIKERKWQLAIPRNNNNTDRLRDRYFNVELQFIPDFQDDRYELAFLDSIFRVSFR